MNQPEWLEAFRCRPTAIGWYAVRTCWDSEEGFFPQCAFWDGSNWTGDYVPIIIEYWSQRFETRDEADRFSREHDPEL